LSELLRNVGINVPDSTATLAHTVHPDAATATGAGSGSTVRFEDSHHSVVLPSSDKPEDMYTRSSNHTRESTFLRMENLFDEISLKIRNLRYAALSEAERMELPGDLEEYSTASLRSTGKPTVIGDSIPPPMMIPAPVQHVSATTITIITVITIIIIIIIIIITVIITISLSLSLSSLPPPPPLFL